MLKPLDTLRVAALPGGEKMWMALFHLSCCGIPCTALRRLAGKLNFTVDTYRFSQFPWSLLSKMRMHNNDAVAVLPQDLFGTRPDPPAIPRPVLHRSTGGADLHSLSFKL